MLDFVGKYLRYPIALVLSFVLSAVFFLAIPVINVLISDKGVKGQKELEAVTEVEVLVSEKKPEVKQKVIRTIVNPNPFKITSNMGVSLKYCVKSSPSSPKGRNAWVFRVT